MISQKIKEIEKGCGEGFCGKFIYHKDTEPIDTLCSTCLAKLQSFKEASEMIEKVIDEYIRTDLQGHPLPECKILWEIKQKLGVGK